MKKVAYMFAAVMALVMTACVGSEYDEMIDTQSSIVKKGGSQEVVKQCLVDSFAVTSEETAMAYILEASVLANGDTVLTGVLETQPLYRQINTIDLGSKETKKYGEMRVVQREALTPTTADPRAGYGNFVVTTNVVVVNSVISNGDVNFDPEYKLEYETCSWSNGDTTFVFSPKWEIENEFAKVDAEGKVSDELHLNFCGFRQTANEFGNLTLSATFEFSVTLDPNQPNRWLVGHAETVANGTLAIALEPDGTPIAADFWPGEVNDAYNGAYFIKGKWHPCIASDRNNGMEWGKIGTKFNMISYAEADAYTNWGNDNIKIYGQHSVKLSGYSVKDDPQSQTLTFFYNGIERGSLSYAKLE